MDNIKEFGPKLRSEIDKRGYKTYKKAADAFGISLSYLNQLMRNEREPSLEMLATIADELGVTPSYLIGEGKASETATPDKAQLILALQSRLTSLDEGQLRRVDKFITDLLKPSSAAGSASDVG